ncbi:MAG: DUF5915 domain-containing protein, partial [Candidatus Neomarinimicrobiota bacterium]|nr:DUF5915 domain-containing protein [Candidatus Neomarinimicrobiota bacterium]
ISDKDYWNKWFPGDFVVECFPGQFRNWFYSLLAMSTVMEGKAPFKTLLGHALVKDETGRDMHKSWGNAIWFDDAAEKMGVDVMRWMYTAQNPEHNLLFGYDNGNEVRKKLIQLWNSYSFFATYAAVDGFDPIKDQISESDLQLMDKWILSKLHSFIKDSEISLNEFRADKLMRKFEIFLEELSNWYIRRSRRRFWKSEDDNDKKAAYQVLYEVLATSIKVLAPVLPFVTEEIYQNLICNLDKNSPESIHLCDYPKADESKINNELIEKIDPLRKLVEYGRSARNKANVKIRQPLSELSFHIEDDNIADFIKDQQSIVLDELNVKTLIRVESASELIKYDVKPNLPLLGQKFGKDLDMIRKCLTDIDSMEILDEIRKSKKYKLEFDSKQIFLLREDLLIDSISNDGLSSNGDDSITVGITLKLDNNLIMEGIVRDIIRQVQNMRKNANFAVEDRIKIYMDIEGTIKDAIHSFEELFKNEVLATEIYYEFNEGDFSDKFVMNGQEIQFGLKRVKI